MNKILNKDEFSTEVILFAKNNNLSYVDSLQYHVEKYDIDLTIIKKLIDPRLNQFLIEEAQNLNIIKKSSDTIDDFI